MDKHAVEPSVLARLEELGGKKLTGGLIQMYMERTPEKMKTITSGMSNSDFKEIENAAHSLISVAGNLGGMMVSQLSMKLEAAAISKNMSEISEVVAVLIDVEKTFSEFLKVEMEKP